MSNRIKTNIKFYKGLNDAEDRIYGFVTKVNGSWKGCRESEAKKKIVFVDESIAPSILPNTLYHCVLIPMKTGNGFVALSAKILKFKATIATISHKDTFVVAVKFGNKEIIYDPSSRDVKRNDIVTIANIIRKRDDLKDAHTTAEDFIDNALMAKRLYDHLKGYVR